MNTKQTKILTGLVASTVFASALLVSLQTPAAEVEMSTEVEEQETVNRPEVPGFRTDLGIQFSFGGHSCIGGGSNYASCYGTDTSWDTSWGLGGGFLARPFKLFSVGVNISYYTMKLHEITDNKWGDLLLGPVAKFHFPFMLGARKLLFEPNIGLQGGFAKGTYSEEKLASTEKVGWEHEHLGAFLAIPFGVDFFPIPKLGVGLEFKLVRTFYTEVCFESRDLTTCRGVNDKAAEDNWDLSSTGIPNDKGIATYPWKLFWGLHVLYYI